MLDGLKSMLRQRDFLFLLAMFFIGLGLFNGLSTWIEDIVRPRGFTITQAGWLGGFMLLGGIVGAVVMPILSDKIRRRKPFIVIALAGLLPGLVGMTFTGNYIVLLASGFVFGYFLLSAGPIGFQYAAEITHPAPEGASNNVLLLMGQISGIAFILAMDVFKSKTTGSMTASMLTMTGLVVVALALSPFLPESLKRPGRSES
jgi:cyanate permease